MNYKDVGDLFSTGGLHGVRRSMELSVKDLQSIFVRKHNNRSTCHLFWQDTDISSRSVSNRSTSTSKFRFWNLFKSACPMILHASFQGLMVESYLLRLLCLAMVCRSIVRHSTVFLHSLPAKSLLSLASAYHDW